MTERTTDITATGLVVVLAGAALAPVEQFKVNVALPEIRAGLHGTPATLSWVVAGYGLVLALLLVPSGRLGDAVGRRRALVAGLLGFALASAACAAAPSTAILVPARIAQGACGAAIIPQTLAIIQTATSGERRARAIGYYGATGGAAMVVGQLVGGGLVAADIAGTGWRATFLANVPVGLVLAVLARRTLPESNSGDDRSAPDLTGSVGLAVVLVALLVPLVDGKQAGWPWWCWTLLLVVFPGSCLGLAWFERRLEQTGRPALLPASLLGLPGMRTGLACVVPLFVGFGGFLYCFALVVQDDLGAGPLQAGLVLVPLGVGFLALSLASSRLAARFGRSVVTGGATAAVAGAATLAGSAATWPTGPVALLPGLLLLGAGLGAAAPTLFRVVLSGIPADRSGSGSGVLTTMQQVATATGVATLGSLYLAARPTLGGRSAWLVAVGCLAATMVSVAVLSRRLPGEGPSGD